MTIFAKIFLFLIIAFSSRTDTYSIGNRSSVRYQEGDRYFLFADGFDNLYWIDSQEVVEEDIGVKKFDVEKHVIFNLYTRANPTNPNVIVNNSSMSLLTSTFNKKNPIKIIVHGWQSDIKSDLNSVVRDAFLKNGDVNVIYVDWSKGAKTAYTRAMTNVITVGNYLATFIDWLVKDEKISLNNFHLMGHSLGSHVVGIAGRELKSGLVPYITGFDPAAPFYSPSSNRIRPTDGKYVEIIHTSDLGLDVAVGHNDFYPNKGNDQPGCWFEACSHSRSYYYFADSIDHTGFMADQCLTTKEISKNKCSNLSKLHMGGVSPKPAVGLFLLKTNKKQPYYKN